MKIYMHYIHAPLTHRFMLLVLCILFILICTKCNCAQKAPFLMYTNHWSCRLRWGLTWSPSWLSSLVFAWSDKHGGDKEAVEISRFTAIMQYDFGCQNWCIRLTTNQKCPYRYQDLTVLHITHYTFKVQHAVEPLNSQSPVEPIWELCLSFWFTCH